MMKKWICLLLAVLVLVGTAAFAEDTGEKGTVDFQDVQYVLFLGTNDKDTNTPVFTEAESFEQLKEILIRHFGGFTIQEAHGGWMDGDKLYQEFTLMIYLSDVTLEQVHAAADEMIEVFRQSTVLIQTNPTRTEFYSYQSSEVPQAEPTGAD